MADHSFFDHVPGGNCPHCRSVVAQEPMVLASTRQRDLWPDIPAPQTRCSTAVEGR